MNKNDFFQILLFIGLCFYMATCTSALKKDRLGVEGHRTMKMTKESELRKDIVRFSKKFIGTRYRAGGKTPKGFDCSGYTGYVMREFGVELNASARSQETQGKKITTDKVQPGDLIFFRRSRSGSVFHVGIVVSNTSDGITMIHGSSSRGIVIDNINKSSYWKSKIMTARNMVGDK